MRKLQRLRFVNNSHARVRHEVEWIVRKAGRKSSSASGRIKLDMDLSRLVSIGRCMDETNIRELFTQIGCIMEDATVVALVWSKDDGPAVTGRLEALVKAHDEMGRLLTLLGARVR